MLSLKTMGYTDFYREITPDGNAPSYFCTRRHVSHTHPPTACSTLTEQPANTVREALCSHLGKYLHKYLEQDKCYHLKGKKDGYHLILQFQRTKEKKRFLRLQLPLLPLYCVQDFYEKEFITEITQW